ncbi:cytidyltransferase-related domain protein [Thalassoporum mexicanum PCC 7367]|uniref:nicotinate-nucleotide adenylyltransferase n=1 Tax=Thalassoporum mexicanum TaxID=3457544 RepID=UPI00029F8691|nr:nicotinate-nucleotide adenylyltransferase [Pseudanabaena sp. PCC 7367]AFY70686.1 cytidyltransferase-related domain protein [Pseudanabaena sp. PCC 7367]
MNIALFGSSADPPTVGHKAIIEWLGQKFDLCVIWVSNNPFKSHQASMEQRLEMVRRMIAEINNAHPDRPNIELHPEISSPRSLFTVQQAQQIWPDATFHLVVGSDIVPQLHSWYHANQLLNLVNLLIVPRQGYALSEQDLEALRIRRATFAIANIGVPQVSSSAYRECDDDSGIVSSVAEYIHQEHLYEWQEARPVSP